MKLRVSLLLLGLVFSGSYHAYAQQSKPKTPQQAKPTITAAKQQEIEEGKLLLTKSDCLACHKLQDKLVGPAYVEIAKKYPDTEANVALLVTKIIKGGSGIWGAVPMAPHATLSPADGKKIVRYILSIKPETR